MGCFYGVFYRLAQGTLFTTTAHLVYEDTKCMTDADMSTVMGRERVRITGGASTPHGANDTEIFHPSYRFEVFPWSNRSKVHY